MCRLSCIVALFSKQHSVIVITTTWCTSRSSSITKPWWLSCGQPSQSYPFPLYLTANCQSCASVTSPTHTLLTPSPIMFFQTIHPTWTLDALSSLNLCLGKVACHLNQEISFCFLVEKALSWWKWVLGLNARATSVKRVFSLLTKPYHKWLCDRKGVSFEFLMVGRLILNCFFIRHVFLVCHQLYLDHGGTTSILAKRFTK